MSWNPTLQEPEDILGIAVFLFQQLIHWTLLKHPTTGKLISDATSWNSLFLPSRSSQSSGKIKEPSNSIKKFTEGAQIFVEQMKKTHVLIDVLRAHSFKIKWLII